MKFIFVNGRTPRSRSFCTLCCEPIGETYVREIATRLSFCDHQCYLAHCELDAQPPISRDGADMPFIIAGLLPSS
jgi:hypothetical protein